MSDFSFVPLRPFLCAALAKRWKVQFRKGLHKLNNVDLKKRHILMRTAVLCNGINSGHYEERIKHYIYKYIYIYVHSTSCAQG